MAATLAIASTLAACASPTAPSGPAPETLLPLLGGDLAVLEATPADERGRLRLVATNLVAALVQIPELRPASATLKLNRPGTAFGNALVRALEDAGFGLQVVPADRGPNYVGYSRRVAETETGPVTDYVLSVDGTSLSREYSVDAQGAIFPSSLMRIEGTDHVADIEMADGIFREQGAAGTSFVSGARDVGDGATAGTDVSTVDVNDYDELPETRRTPRAEVLDDARRRYFRDDSRRAAPELARYDEFRRTVLIFDDPESPLLGDANKRTLRLLARDVGARDVVVITACQDVDGKDERALGRGILVEEELASLGLAASNAWLAPCVRSSYRHPSDKSPVPVEVVHMRPKVTPFVGRTPLGGGRR